MIRKGWIMTKQGETYEVPEVLLDEETISWPFTLQEVTSGDPAPMLTPNDLYRRHEIVPSEAFLYLREHISPHSIPETVIRDMLGPLAARRPTRFEVRPRDLKLMAEGIGQRSLETRPHCLLVVPHSMWNDADVSTRNSFHNICRISGVKYRVENIGLGGAYWDCSVEHAP